MVSKYLIGAAMLLTRLNADNIFEEDQGNDHVDYPEFTDWANSHGKEYESPEEESKRRDIYEDNLKTIKDHNNSNNSSYEMGVNQLSDLTSDEFANLISNPYMQSSPSSQNNFWKQSSVMKSKHPLPEEVDWRKKNAVTHVKNQYVCGSCWAFSTTGSVEGAHAIKTGQLLSLSEQQLIDCSYVKYAIGTTVFNQGCNGGVMDYGFQYIMDNGGIATEDEYSYYSLLFSLVGFSHGTCNKTKENKHSAKIYGYTNVTQYDENALMQAVAKQPVSVGVSAAPGWFLYKKGVYDGTINGNTKKGGCGIDMDHGVLVVGYTKDYWIVKNSWGTSWGMEGYMHLKRNVDCKNYPKFCNKDGTKKYGMCGILQAASYPWIEDESNQMQNPQQKNDDDKVEEDYNLIHYAMIFCASAIALFFIFILCINLQAVEAQEKKEVLNNMEV